MDSIQKMFIEMGLNDDFKRSRILDKNKFDFNFKGATNKNFYEVITSHNTKSEELCPTGTKLENSLNKQEAHLI